MKKLVLSSLLALHSAYAGTGETFVLVHGALFTGDGFSKLETVLRAKGHRVISPDVAGRRGDGLDPKSVDLNVAVDGLAQIIEQQPGQVILVGHSQGGALITQLTDQVAHKIKALVYLAAVVPASGETAFDKLSPITQANFGRTAVPDPELGVFRIVEDKKVVEEAFFQFLRQTDSAAADLALAQMVNEPIGIGTTPLSYDLKAFNAIPKFYIETLKDQVVDIANQREYQSRFQFKKIYSIEGSHSPFLNQTKQVAEALLDVATEIRYPSDEVTEELQTVAEFYQAFQTGDFQKVTDLLSDDVTWNQPGQGPLSGVYEGKSAVLGLFAKLGEENQGSLRLEVKSLLQNGHSVLVGVEYSASRKGKILRGQGQDLFVVHKGQILEATLFSENQKEEDAFYR